VADKRRQRRATIVDVARRAGVSQTAVSFVLNNVENVNIREDTRARIREAVQELGYRPNMVAQGLRSSRSHSIGFLTADVASHQVAGDMLRGAQDAAWEHGMVLIIVNTGGDARVTAAAIDMMLHRQVEGILYAYRYHDVVEPPKSIFEVPAVLVDCFSADRSLPSVVPDEVDAGRVVTDLLLRKGHRRIGMINVDFGVPAATGRLAGYRLALEQHGVPFDDALVRHGDGHAEKGYDLTRELIQVQDPPTALFCGNDRTAMGAYDALKELGLRIPDDLAVVGFDNQEIISAHLRPPLTTMQLPYYEMGRWAVEYVLTSDADLESGAQTQHRLPCPLILRSSA
jgi:LacI family transcriptional regulator, galactose operon repressor